MSFPNRIRFQQNQSQVGRPPVNDDYISGMNFYGSYPTALSGFPQFSGTKNTIPFLSLQQAINSGINGNHTGETPATGTLTMAETGAAGKILNIYVAEAFGNVLIATYTTQTGDTSSATTYATNVKNAINANTLNNGGYTATSSTDVVTITARGGLGTFPNTGTPISVSGTAGGDATIAQFSDGVASLIDIWYYHISEYFRQMPNGKLFVTIYPTYNSGTAAAFGDILAAQAFAQGAIRQFGVFTGATHATSIVTAAKNVKNQLFTNNQPAEIWLANDLIGSGATWTGTSYSGGSFADISGLPDMSGLSASGIGVVIGQDGAAQGALLFYAYGHSITTLGATLGATSNAPVNVDIGWVQQYNLSNGTELAIPAFANGQLYNSVFYTENNALTQVDNYRYNFIITYSGQVGTYFNDDKTATLSTDSFANMNDNRTIDKVQRVVYANLLPLVNGPIDLNADGTMSNKTIVTISNMAFTPMEQMASVGELAAITEQSSVSIDASQNVVENDGITIAVTPTENGTARNIFVPIGYAN